MPFSKTIKTAKRAGMVKRSARAQSLIEALIGFVVLIPIGLASVNLVTLISTTQTNEQWAETAARAAACCTCETMSQTAAKSSLRRFVPSNIISSVEAEKVSFDKVAGQVTVSTVMQVNMPIPMPLMNKFECRASATQPILATPATQ
jgi:hypothetical protein